MLNFHTAMFSNFRKETSERSDAMNWAKQSLMRDTPFHYDSIEGCNENNLNLVTHLMERARVDYDGVDDMDAGAVCEAVVRMEGMEVMERKINFANAFHVKLSYVLYNDESQKVWLYEFERVGELRFVRGYESYEAFSGWIAEIKGWKSSKTYRETADLPFFDRELRRFGTAWPTNIDCFVSTPDNLPVAILEFQNAKNTSVIDHCNNEFFLCKQEIRDASTGSVKYHDDIRRWLSQEILRVQSGLRLLIVTWAQDSVDFILKEVERITFPDLPFEKDWTLTNNYKRDMHEYSVKKDRESGMKISKNYHTYNLEYEDYSMKINRHAPPLTASEKTFPFMYYRTKDMVLCDDNELPKRFTARLTAFNAF